MGIRDDHRYAAFKFVSANKEHLIPTATADTRHALEETLGKLGDPGYFNGYEGNRWSRAGTQSG